MTGYGNDRINHRNTIAACGGAAYSPELSSDVTHLVVGPDYQSRDELLTNGKYLCAKQINSKRAKRQESNRQIWIVWGEWLEHCLCAFGRVREEPYSAEVVPNREEIVPPHGEPSPDIIARRDSASPRKMRKHKSRDDHAQIKSKRKLIKQETLPSMDEANGPTRKRAAEEDECANESKRAKKELEFGQDRIGPISDDLTDADPTSTETLEPVAVKKQSASLATDPLQPRERSASLAPRQSMKKQQSSTHLELLGVQELLTVKQEQPSQIATVASTSTSVAISKGFEDHSTQPEAGSIVAGSLLAKMGKARSNKFASGKQKESTVAEAEASTSQAPLSAGYATENVKLPATAPRYDEIVQAYGDDEDIQPPSAIFEGMSFYIVPGEFEDVVIPRVREAITDRGGVIASCDSKSVDVVLCKTIS